MNWERGLFRLWLLVSVLWVAAVIGLASFIEIDLACLFSIKPACPFRPGSLAGMMTTASGYNYFGWVFTLGPPAGVYLLGRTLLWIGRGFRRQG